MADTMASHDEWTTKEKFILACCVTRSGDQNWVSVCRTMRLILEACDDSHQRPPDFFSQKNCAMKYNQLLNTASVMKRKSRGSSTEPVNIETPAEQILRKLTFQRIEELDRAIKADRDKYKKLKNDIEKIRSGKLDDQLPRIWQAIQSGQVSAIEELIKEDPPIETLKEKEEIQTTVASTSSVSQSTISRPQRATKETEKFKSYIEQRQKHNAKYHHNTSSAASTPSTSPALTQNSSISTLTSTSDLSTVSPSVVGPSPAQVQNMASRFDTNPHTPASAQGLLITKSDVPVPSSQTQDQLSKQPNSQLQKPSPKKSSDQSKSQTSGSISPVKKTSDNKETSYLSSLLAAPAADIKAQVNQINETLKEPIKNIHQVTKESYEAYKKAQPVDQTILASKGTAPMLSKLLKSVHPPTQLDSTSLNQPIDSMKSETSTEPKQVTKNLPASTTPPKSVNTPVQEVVKAPMTSESNIGQSKKEEEVVVVKPVKQEEPEPADKAEADEKLDESTKLTPKESALDEKNTSEPLSIDVDENVAKVSSSTNDRDESTSSVPETSEPPAKKRLTEAVVSSGDNEVNTSPVEPLDLSLVHSPKVKRKGKGRGNRSVSRKKTPSGSMKFDVPSEDDADTESENVNESKDADVMDSSDDFSEKKIKTPLTPSIPSPASPALSTGSNCDPETAQQQRAWRKSIMLVWKAAASHKYANVFLHPVTDEEAPGYSSIIYRPMDLSLIKKNIETGVIHTTTEFQRDIMLMFQNALMYNRKEHDVYRMAQEMRDDVMEQIKSFISTQLMVQTTDRDSKILRIKADTPGHTRQSSKSGFTFLSL